jgi:hypothetical protein
VSSLRYAVSRSCGRQPIMTVSSETTSAVKPATLAQPRIESITSLLRGLITTVLALGGKMMMMMDEHVPVELVPSVSVGLGHGFDGARAGS